MTAALSTNGSGQINLSVEMSDKKKAAQHPPIFHKPCIRMKVGAVLCKKHVYEFGKLDSNSLLCLELRGTGRKDCKNCISGLEITNYLYRIYCNYAVFVQLYTF